MKFKWVFVLACIWSQLAVAECGPYESTGDETCRVKLIDTLVTDKEESATTAKEALRKVCEDWKAKVNETFGQDVVIKICGFAKFEGYYIRVPRNIQICDYDSSNERVCTTVTVNEDALHKVQATSQSMITLETKRAFSSTAHVLEARNLDEWKDLCTELRKDAEDQLESQLMYVGCESEGSGKLVKENDTVKSLARIYMYEDLLF